MIFLSMVELSAMHPLQFALQLVRAAPPHLALRNSDTGMVAPHCLQSSFSGWAFLHLRHLALLGDIIPSHDGHGIFLRSLSVAL
jgi:hypothetical protein